MRAQQLHSCLTGTSIIILGIVQLPGCGRPTSVAWEALQTTLADCGESACVQISQESLEGPIAVGKTHAFRGFTSEDIASVEILVDGWSIGRTAPVSRAFTIAYAFQSPGESRTLVVRGKGTNGTILTEHTHPIQVRSEPVPEPTTGPEPTPIPGPNEGDWEAQAAQWGVSLTAPASSLLTGYRTLVHTAQTAVSRPMTENEGRKLFFEGMVPQAGDRQAFNRAVADGVVPRHGSAQCAVTTSSVIEHAALRVAMGDLGAIFSKPRRDSQEDPLACTDQVETELRRLGWYYYVKDKFVAPRSAIAMMKGRYNFCGTPSHSGHIYTILQDNGMGNRDRIADNGGYDHLYSYETGGFWLPPGVYPQGR